MVGLKDSHSFRCSFPSLMCHCYIINFLSADILINIYGFTIIALRKAGYR